LEGVNSKLWLRELLLHIDQLLKSPGTKIIAIDGNAGAGKSTLATLIAEEYPCNVFHMDHYFLPPEKKTKERLSQPGGNVDRERFKNEILESITKSKEFVYNIYDCKTDKLSLSPIIAPMKLNIVEGAYSMHPDLIGYYHLKIFISIDGEEQSSRILKRNGPDLHEMFINSWIPLENLYFTRLKIKEKADICLSP
jgi:uridine kinase